MLAIDRLRAALTRNVARTRADHPDPRLRGRRYRLPRAAVWSAVEGEVRASRGWSIVATDAGQLQVEARTRFCGFVDDVRISVLEAGDGTVAVHLHSASRVGRADLGTNARRIARFLQSVDRRLAEPGSPRP